MPPKKDFQWTDDEAELLLNVTLEYRTSKAAVSVDWESVKSKYNDIWELMTTHTQRTKSQNKH